MAAAAGARAAGDELLEAVVRVLVSEGYVTPSMIAKRMGLDLSRVYWLMRNWMIKGYLRRISRGVYVLGPRAFSEILGCSR